MSNVQVDWQRHLLDLCFEQAQVPCVTFDIYARMQINFTQSLFEGEAQVFDVIKGIVHHFFFYRSNLIFWIVMGCGIADFGRRGL